MLAVRGRRAVEVAGLHQGLPGATRAEPRSRTARAGMKVTDPDRANPQHLGRPMPDLGERLVAYVPAGDRHRDARHDVSVGADVAGVVRSAARDVVEVLALGR